ncbi:hypothetical protein I79_024475 [Cricetulus griseus]|uniref:Secreted protein n=1 Tax=Cricetulus griseus TaxID=10029 RepID=G3IKS2_CRIGR|nr:hypothetical protein I79_024475 [Cricetulus griseus]
MLWWSSGTWSSPASHALHLATLAAVRILRCSKLVPGLVLSVGKRLPQDLAMDVPSFEFLSPSHSHF